MDTPLCETGLKQASGLYNFLKKEVKVEEGDNPAQIFLQGGTMNNDTSVVCCSNLRRAISTALIGLQDRLQSSGEQVHMLSCLQEISRNIDANAIAEKYQVPFLHGIEKQLSWDGFDVDRAFDTSKQLGQKKLFGSGMQRLWDFNEWSFARKETVIIVGGGHR